MRKLSKLALWVTWLILVVILSDTTTQACSPSVTIKEISFLGDNPMYQNSVDHGGWGVGTAISDPVWVDGGANWPVCYTRSSYVTMVVKFDVHGNLDAGVSVPVKLLADGPGALTNATYSFNVTGNDTVEQTATLTTAGTVTNVVWTMSATFAWKIICCTSTNFVRSTTHTMYVTYGNPSGSTPTPKRVDWACTEGHGAGTISAAAEKFRDAIAANPGYSEPRVWNLNSWEFLESGQHGDCITLAALATAGLQIIGIPAQYRWSYPTADGSSGFPPVSGTSCQSVATKVFPYSGQSFNAKLVYPGNNFEGFFTVSDPNIKAYTVYTPGGPFSNATYYYLQVLQFADGVGGDQFWVWNGTQTSNGVTVNDWDQVPGAAHIPVPPLP